MAKKDTVEEGRLEGSQTGEAEEARPGSSRSRESYRLTKKTDPRIGLILLGVFLVAGVLAGGIAYLVARPPRLLDPSSAC